MLSRSKSQMSFFFTTEEQRKEGHSLVRVRVLRVGNTGIPKIYFQKEPRWAMLPLLHLLLLLEGHRGSNMVAASRIRG